MTWLRCIKQHNTDELMLRQYSPHSWSLSGHLEPIKRRKKYTNKNVNNITTSTHSSHLADRCAPSSPLGWAALSRCEYPENPSLPSYCRSLSPGCTGSQRSLRGSRRSTWKENKQLNNYCLTVSLQLVMYCSNSGIIKHSSTYAPLSTWMERVEVLYPNSSTSGMASVTSKVFSSSTPSCSSSGCSNITIKGSVRSCRRKRRRRKCGNNKILYERQEWHVTS